MPGPHPSTCAALQYPRMLRNVLSPADRARCCSEAAAAIPPPRSAMPSGGRSMAPGGREAAKIHKSHATGAPWLPGSNPRALFALPLPCPLLLPEAHESFFPGDAQACGPMDAAGSLRTFTDEVVNVSKLSWRLVWRARAVATALLQLSG